MNLSGKAIVLTNGLFDTKSAKTAHGLIRASRRFSIVAIIDKKFAGLFALLDENEKIHLNENSKGIPVYKDVKAFVKSSCEASFCIVGVASAGGVLPNEMRTDIIESMNSGLSIINGLHSMLNEDSELKSFSKKNNVQIHDIRKIRPREDLSFWSGKISEVKSTKIVVMGTDCGLGKRTTAKMVVDALNKKGCKADMIYTGQTGWMQGWDYGFVFDLIPILICIILFVFSLFILMPLINKYRDQNKKKKFKYAHTSSVIINFLQMILLVTVIF